MSKLFVRFLQSQLVWFAVLLIITGASPLSAQSPPSQDTFVSSATPKINYGPGITLVVGPGTTSYVQFNLSGIPAGASVSKASLRLYVDGVGKSGAFDVYELDSGWSEKTLTFSTPPPTLGASVTRNHPISITASRVNQFLLIDITSLVQAWLDGTTPNNGVALALTSDSTGSFSFDSKESLLTGNGPELEIALASGVGPQGPPGPQGIQGLAGPMGLQGPAGVDGAIGPRGPQGTPGQGFTFKAEFDTAAPYSAYDVVTFNGSSYVAKAATKAGDQTPDSNPNWSLMAQQGAAGPQGPKGDTGPQGAQGVQGLAGLQGLPGITGAPGPQGPTGANGTSFTFRGPFSADAEYAANDVVTFNGSTYIATAANRGEDTPDINPIWVLIAQAGAQGPAGPEGQPGPRGLTGVAGPKGDPGAMGATGATGPQGPQGPQGPAGMSGFNGTQEFTNPNNLPSAILSWEAPSGITHVLVEMWGGGGGGGGESAGGGGAYSRSVILVTPGTLYLINVGGGGGGGNLLSGKQGDNGSTSSMTFLDGGTLIFAGGGFASGVAGPTDGLGGSTDPAAAISHSGISGALGGAAFGANFCPGPLGNETGHGGPQLGGGQPGYVLLTW